ncbi:hypothetical protein [Brunnivagina elsteri]|uniref:Uncharacterized protein n=1 Tax=Brunnivagina elsteri CCALA 953 TaxID=987040 RepID=A0A2A2TN18_9CYAN|nr:hypothetical protein [Calothrix elsteri]PAX59853.1 hypothetical protein CK510_04940 [Calothrix elsteri CCALA 953]
MPLALSLKGQAPRSLLPRSGRLIAMFDWVLSLGEKPGFEIFLLKRELLLVIAIVGGETRIEN